MPTASIAVRRLPLALALLAATGAGATLAAQVGGAKAVTQICLAPAVVEAAPQGADPIKAVEETFTSFLAGPTLTVQPLTARLQGQVREEAKLNGCQFLVFPTVKHVRKTGGGGFLGKVASGAVQQGAYSVGTSSGAVGRVVAGAAAGAASSAASDYAAGSRTRDELTLSYRLESAAGKVLVERSEKRKAKSDGEDLLTPLVQHAAETVADAAAREVR